MDLGQLFPLEVTSLSILHPCRFGLASSLAPKQEGNNRGAERVWDSGSGLILTWALLHQMGNSGQVLNLVSLGSFYGHNLAVSAQALTGAPCTSSISITWEFIRHALLGSHPRPAQTELWGGPSNLFTTL